MNAQLESGVPAATSFEPITIPVLRTRWLDHHEHVKRSSVATVGRYRTATQYLINYIQAECPRIRQASNLGPSEAEAFTRWLRGVTVAPNGHKNSAKRKLLDKGITYILECCRSMFTYAIKRRHLPPYTDNPFAAIEIDAIAIENAKPIVLLTMAEERALLQVCDTWDQTILLTLMLTGMRPGELCHLLLPYDLDLEAGLLRISNKPRLGWQVKTRSERAIPLHPVLLAKLMTLVSTRRTGAVFRQRRCADSHVPPLEPLSIEQLEREALQRVAQAERQNSLSRKAALAVQRTVWRDLAAVDEDDIRHSFIRACRKIGLPHQTAPKVLRHGFATMLQDANVDPLVRNFLMGHSIAGGGGSVVRSTSLGMTAVYTHTRAETVRRQLIDAINARGTVNGLFA